MTTSQNTFCDVVEVHVAHAVRLICRLIGNCRQDPQTYHVCLPVLPLSGDFRSPQDRLDLVGHALADRPVGVRAQVNAVHAIGCSQFAEVEEVGPRSPGDGL